MPVSKLLRRANLSVRRHLRDRFPTFDAMELQSPPLSVSPPLPLFPPRASSVTRTPTGWEATFLNRTLPLGQIIDWAMASRGARDQLWRMNLHYMEYLESSNQEDFEALLTAWLDGNSITAPGTWRDSWNSYALSLRVVVWMQHLAARTDIVDSELKSRAVASLGAQLRFLERNLETDLGGNHLVKNIKALIWAGRFFSGADADRWLRTGVALLDRELDVQIFADGMHDERSASYHCQVLCDLMECRHALSGDPLNGQLDAAIDRMAQVAADLRHPDGSPVLFNDSGLSMAYAPGDALEAYKALTGRQVLPRATFALRDAGYFGFRGHTGYLVMDCGRIAPDDLPAHGHGDILSFEWSVAGERVIVDQGVYEYVAGERRQQARSAANHNTLSFADADQADFFGAFRCGRRPNPLVLNYAAHDGGFSLTGTHDGFDRLPGKPRHTRTLAASDLIVEIEDHIEGHADRKAHVAFLLHPDVRVWREGCEVRIARGAAVIGVSCSLPVTVKSAVWWPDMGVEEQTSRLIVEVEPGCPKLKTTFRVL